MRIEKEKRRSLEASVFNRCLRLIARAFTQALLVGPAVAGVVPAYAEVFDEGVMGTGHLGELVVVLEELLAVERDHVVRESAASTLGTILSVLIDFVAYPEEYFLCPP